MLIPALGKLSCAAQIPQFPVLPAVTIWEVNQNGFSKVICNFLLIFQTSLDSSARETGGLCLLLYATVSGDKVKSSVRLYKARLLRCTCFLNQLDGQTDAAWGQNTHLPLKDLASVAYTHTRLLQRSA